MKAFFRRALAWEKSSEEGIEEGAGISLSEERDGVYLFQRGQESGIMLEGCPTKLPFQQIRSIAPGDKGFDLVIIDLDKVSKYTGYRYFLSLG